ncbi:MAG TPA: DciA family protein [Thermoanaerobaculia bacterium]|nr:DciA family protein [Thermoanaerobaculia bacterium]
MTSKPRDPFTRLDQAGSRSLGKLLRRRGSPVVFEARWADVLGPYLSRKISPASFSAGDLALRVSDPSCRRTVAGLLPEIERKLREAFPHVSRVRLL